MMSRVLPDVTAEPGWDVNHPTTTGPLSRYNVPSTATQ